ncbi:glutamine amidotransferase-related protein [Rouxiella sp. Mn2063]|uniref:glutamine amidotransferase-related protein n=1 Tax=Rouxiella sp. Mn2063 TaxID=3395262 RepID=UPI003BBC0566
MLTLIAHTTPEPALYGALAAILAELRAVPLCHLPVSFDAKRFAYGRQYVTSQGQEIASGLLWLERLTGRDAGSELPLPALINRAMKEDIVLPVNVDLHSTYCDDIGRLAAEHGIAIERLQVVKRQGRFQLEDGDSGKVRSNGWTQDSFGRWILGAWSQPVMRAGKKIRLGLVGDVCEHRDSYPATLAALGDAADALAMNIEIIYINPSKLGSQLEALLFEVDGILLSGLGDMHSHNTAGQLTVVHWALETHTPIMGINQGMHLMVAALGQQYLGHQRVVMSGPAALNTLQTSLPVDGGSPRLGNHRVLTHGGSQLGHILDSEIDWRYNQRWSLNPELADELASYGLQIGASSVDEGAIQAIELSSHPFFIGVQGQPELQSRRERPSHLLMAFLKQLRQSNQEQEINRATITKGMRCKHSSFLMG